jgi:hypothetical protein
MSRTSFSDRRLAWALAEVFRLSVLVVSDSTKLLFVVRIRFGKKARPEEDELPLVD